MLNSRLNAWILGSVAKVTGDGTDGVKSDGDGCGVGTI